MVANLKDHNWDWVGIKPQYAKDVLQLNGVEGAEVINCAEIAPYAAAGNLVMVTVDVHDISGIVHHMVVIDNAENGEGGRIRYHGWDPATGRSSWGPWDIDCKAVHVLVPKVQ